MIKRFSKWNKSVPNYSDLQEMACECIIGAGKKLDILELGIGKGGTAIEILNRFPYSNYLGVDNNNNSLKIAKSNLKKFKSVVFKFSELMNFSAKNNSFNAVVAVLTLHHLTNKEKITILKRIRRWLKKGGVLVIGDLIKLEDALMQSKAIDVFNTYRERVLSRSDKLEMKRHLEKEKHIINTLAETKVMLKAAGFKKVDLVWCFYRLVVIRAS